MEHDTSRATEIVEKLSQSYKLLLEKRDSYRNAVDELLKKVVQMKSTIDSNREDLMIYREKLKDMEYETVQAHHSDEEPRNHEEIQIPMIDLQSIPKKLYVKRIIEITEPSSYICSVKFSPNGAFFAIGSDNTIRVYDIENERWVLENNKIDESYEGEKLVLCISWTPDSDTILFVCGEGKGSCLYSYSITRGKVASWRPEGETPIGSIAISPDGKSVFCCIGSSIESRSIDDFSKKLQSFVKGSDKESSTNYVTFSPDGKHFAACYQDQTITIWDIEREKIQINQKCHSENIYSMIYWDDQHLVTCSFDKTIILWDIKDDKLIESFVFRGHTDYVLSIDIDLTKRWLLSGSKDNNLIFTDLEIKQMVYKVQYHENTILSLSFNPVKRQFCSGSGDQKVILWSYDEE